MNWKVFIPLIAICIIVSLAVDKCRNTPVTPPDNTRLTTERKEHLAKEKEGKVIHDTLWMEKIKEQTKLKEVVKYVSVADSAEIERLHDSLVKTKRNAVTFYYEKESYKKQSEISDSIHGVDSTRIFHLTEANLKAETIHANDSLALIQAKKDGKKRFWNGFKWGFGSGYLVGEVKNILIVK